VPAPGEPGSESWRDGHEAWKTGGGTVWVVGAYDPETNRLFYGTGNPAPMYGYLNRPGDNLYTDSTLALDAASGRIAWYFQYTPNDQFDYDETGAHMLLSTVIDGSPHDVLSHFGRNGFYYDLDRATGRFLNGGAYLRTVNWSRGLNPKTGKPLEYDPAKSIQTYAIQAQDGGPSVKVCPDSRGGAEFWPPSYSPLSKLAYTAAWEGCGDNQVAVGLDQIGARALAGRSAGAPPMTAGGTHTNRQPITGSLIAVDPATGQARTRYDNPSPDSAGVTTTAGHLVLTAFLDGTIMALDDETLKPLYTFHAGTYIGAPPVVYAVDGKEYVAILTGGPLPPRIAGPFANHELFSIEAVPMLYVFSL
jgi:alcohol dehydrogenase (cytochrome c)